jgi:hypothetical protein
MQTSLEMFGPHIHIYCFDEAVQDGVVRRGMVADPLGEAGEIEITASSYTFDRL